MLSRYFAWCTRCARLLIAVCMTAGPDEIRGSGPKQSRALGETAAHVLPMCFPIPFMVSFREYLSAFPLVAILRGLRPENAAAIGEALVEGGFRIIEVPLNSPEPLRSIEKTADP